MAFDVSTHCPNCHSTVMLYRFAAGWLGRYERCPHCRTSLLVTFRSQWVEYAYASVFPLTYLYSLAAAAEVAVHFANQMDGVSIAIWSAIGFIAGFLPGFRVAAFLCERFGSVVQGNIGDIFSRAHHPRPRP